MADVQASPKTSGKITPKSDKTGIEINVCQIAWFDSAKTYTIANAPARTSALTFTGDDLNYFARVLYAESSGSQDLTDLDDRKTEKEALINVFHFRLNRKGYPSSRYIATTFSMVCNAPNQFQSVVAEAAQIRYTRIQESCQNGMRGLAGGGRRRSGLSCCGTEQKICL